MRRISVGTLIIAVLIPLLVGYFSSVLSRSAMTEYGTMNKPPLSPPAMVFPIAWTILYIMMGLASYFIIMSEADSKAKMSIMIIYAISLAMNFCWSIVFFNWRMYLVAFIWLLVLWCLVIIIAVKSFNVSKIATVMFIPYILWLTFAAYLNFGAYYLNSYQK